MHSHSSVFSKIRPAAQAGRFYADDPAQLQSDLQRLLTAAGEPTGPVPKAIIAPHAGYTYSGAVAALLYARLRPARDRLRRVLLVGPSHWERFPGLAATGQEAFATPLGLVPIDRELTLAATRLPGVRVFEPPHNPEHSLEVHLPFLQTVLEDFRITPLLVGTADEQTVGRVIDALWGGDETCIVISSDLSHELDESTARLVDSATADQICRLDGAALQNTDACGFEPIRGLLDVARRRGLQADLVALRTSADAGGPRHRVVGYGAFAFTESAARGPR